MTRAVARPRVTVIVPTYLRADRLPGIVAALELQTFPPEDFDVIICDNCSPDETPEVLADLASRTSLTLKVMRTPVNRGPGIARNVAWRTTDATLVAFMDDDCVPTPGWLEAGVAHFEESDVGVVQGRTLPDPAAQIAHFRGTQRIIGLTKRYETCNIFYRREALAAVGGFDENVYFFMEDTVPGFAIRRMGAGDRFAYEALVFHEVVPRGARWTLRWAVLHKNWPYAVRRFPEIRRELLWARIFLEPSHASLLAAIAGAVAGIFWWPALALAAPFLARHTPRYLRRQEFVNKLTDILFDVTVLGAVLYGSIRNRTLVL
ncbi:MAG: glycosyltransferase [Actinomycetota bacterium]